MSESFNDPGARPRWSSSPQGYYCWFSGVGARQTADGRVYCPGCERYYMLPNPDITLPGALRAIPNHLTWRSGWNRRG